MTLRTPVTGFSLVIQEHRYCVKHWMSSEYGNSLSETWSSDWIQGEPNNDTVISLIAAQIKMVGIPRNHNGDIL